jgi:hypothetical protein
MEVVEVTGKSGDSGQETSSSRGVEGVGGVNRRIGLPEGSVRLSLAPRGSSF